MIINNCFGFNIKIFKKKIFVSFLFLTSTFRNINDILAIIRSEKQKTFQKENNIKQTTLFFNQTHYRVAN